MSHLSDDDLTLLHYGERVSAEVQAHADSCPDCAARRRELAQALSSLEPPEIPARTDDYADRVWQRLEPRLAPPRVLRPARPWRRAAGLAALAASLVVAFLLGRSTHRHLEPTTPQVRERILLVALGDHLDRSQMMLVELSHAGGNGPVNVSTERAWADDLVSANRLYRQSAVRAGETGLANVLEELERVLLEVAAGPDQLSPTDLAELQKRIESRGILFKVRVVGSQVRDREKDAQPRAAGTVL